jgi:hypothetical protein
MHSEHLTNVRPGTVGLAWFIGVAATALAVFALIAVGLLRSDGTGGTGWGLLALAAGFLAGGWFAGWRAGAAPILHAVAMGLFSLLFVTVLNVVVDSTLGVASWELSAGYVAGLILLQITAAAIGARWGSRDARRASAAAS